MAQTRIKDQLMSASEIDRTLVRLAQIGRASCRERV
jgi:hypothetical protein